MCHSHISENGKHHILLSRSSGVIVSVHFNQYQHFVTTLQQPTYLLLSPPGERKSGWVTIKVSTGKSRSPVWWAFIIVLAKVFKLSIVKVRWNSFLWWPGRSPSSITSTLDGPGASDGCRARVLTGALPIFCEPDRLWKAVQNVMLGQWYFFLLALSEMTFNMLSPPGMWWTTLIWSWPTCKKSANWCIIFAWPSSPMASLTVKAMWRERPATISTGSFSWRRT